MRNFIYLSLGSLFSRNFRKHFQKNDTLPQEATIKNSLPLFFETAQSEWLKKEVEKIFQRCEQANLLKKISITHFWDEKYPVRLRNIDNPPLVLFVLGSLPNPNVKTLAIVGTRKPDEYGAQVVAEIIPHLVTSELNIVSGLASGIDQLAHEWSNRCKIPNFAFMGNGITQIYPKENEALAREIVAQGGGILTEFAPYTLASPKNFPFRNRLISGISDLVWIVQGAAKSGSYHTAKHALDQGKEIGVTPGSIFSPLSEVPHRLLLEGAHIVRRAGDIDLLLDASAQNP